MTVFVAIIYVFEFIQGLEARKFVRDYNGDVNINFHLRHIGLLTVTFLLALTILLWPLSRHLLSVY
jgi:hypothetical protein